MLHGSNQIELKSQLPGSAKTHFIQQDFEKVTAVKQKKKKKMMEIKCVELTVPQNIQCEFFFVVLGSCKLVEIKALVAARTIDALIYCEF